MKKQSFTKYLIAIFSKLLVILIQFLTFFPKRLSFSANFNERFVTTFKNKIHLLEKYIKKLVVW